MFKFKRIFLLTLSMLLIFSSSINIFASTPEQLNLQKAIHNQSTEVQIASIPVESDIEALELIEKLESSTEPISVEVTRDNPNEKSTQVAVVRCSPTYSYQKGEVGVYLSLWVEGGGIGTNLTQAVGYVAAANNIDGIRMNVNYTNFFPSKNMYISEEGTLFHNLDTDLILFDGYLTVYLTGGWTPADIHLDYEMYL